MILSLIVAVSKNYAIGKDNDLLWHLSDDLKNFKNVTLNKPIVMGRKTYESIGRPLPKRDNIIISRNLNYKVDGAVVFDDPQKAIETLKDHDEVVIIGGAHIYNEFIELVDKIYITHVDCELEADTFFPKFDETKFKLENSYSHPQDEKNEYSWTFCEYSRL